MSFANPYASAFFVAGLMALGALAFGIVARHRTHVFWEYTALVGAAAVHTLAYALDLASTSLELKLFFHRIAWLGVSIAAPAALFLALAFVKKRPSRPIQIAIGAATLSFAALSWTNELHHLLEGPATLVNYAGHEFRVQPRGPLFGSFFLFANACVLTSVGIYGATWLSGPSLHRRHARTLFFAQLAPWVLNTAFFAGSLPIRVTPLALGVSALVITWAFFRHGFLDLVPVAHETVFATLRDPIFVIDGEGRLIDQNSAARALAPIVSGAPAAEHLAFLERAHESGEPEVIEISGRRYELRSVPIGDEGRVVTLYDVTEREAEAQATALALSARSDFIARMSHELRTPLQGVMGSLELLERAGVSGAPGSHVSTAKSSARVLLALLDEILEFERSSAGLVLEPADVDPRAIVHEVATAVSATAELKGLALTTDTETVACEPPLEGDAGRIRQIVLNLAANAVKFTSHGEVRIGAITEPTDDGSVVTFWVDDTGPGVPAGSLRSIFEPFVQLEGARTRRHDGIGLGLAICRQFADAMGAELVLANRQEGGLTSRFSVRLARAKGAKAKRSASIHPEAPIRADVLLVEDHPVSRAVVSELLDALGARVEAVGSGAAAIERASRSRFDVALVDLHMPHMDGLATARGLRALSSPPRVVIFTADERPSVNEECLEAGAAEVLRKPASSSEIAGVLRRSIEGEGHAAVAAPRDQLIEAFAQTYPREIAELRRAVEESDRRACDEILHGMIGASSLLGLTDVTERCREACAHTTHETVARLEASCALASG